MRYCHTMANDVFAPSIPDLSITIIEERFDYQGKKLLVTQTLKEGEIKTIIPGFVEKYKAEKEPTGSEITYVSAVPKEQQKDIERLLEERGFKEKPCFWSEKE